MATTTTNFGWDIPQSTDLVKDGATAIAALGQDIDTALVDLKGGTTGQVLSKASGTDLDFTWVAQDDSNAIQNAIIDAKGDLIVGSAADTPARLAVGSNGQYLVADSTAATGVKWATFSGGGKVLQVVSATTTTQTVVASTSLTDTTLSASITPSSTSSRILVIVTQNAGASRSGDGIGYDLALLRGSTQIWDGKARVSAASELQAPAGISITDSPATTSSVTYKTQIACTMTGSSSSAFAQFDNDPSTITLLEIGA